MPVSIRLRRGMAGALLAAAPLAHPAAARAQEPAVPSPAADPLPFPGEIINQTFRGRDYLAPVLALERAETAYLGSAQWRDLYLELASMQASFAGEVGQAHRLWDLRRAPSASPAVPADAFAGARARDAADAIAEEAARHRAVFLNEAHHVPQHRAFTLQLLQRLYAAGYRWLGVEAVSAADTGLAARGYPVRATGLYTDEPVMGDLVRTALRMGFRVVSYDVTEAVAPRQDDPYFAPNERERLQAENLRTRILEVDPDAKIVVHAGYGHVQDAPAGQWIPMAARFREMTGIDPFTVDQTVMTERGSPAHEHPLYGAALAAGLLAGAPVVMAADSGYRVHGMHTDAQVYHPRTVLEHGRPAWMAMGGARAPYAASVPAEVEAPFLVQAFADGEPDDAVPVDHVVVREGRDAVLVLPPGRYRVRVIDAGGRILGEHTETAGGPRLRPVD